MAAPLVQPQAYYPDGSPIPPADFAKATAEGQARFEEGQKVIVRNELGELKRIDATDIHHPGYTILHPDEVAAIAEHRDYGQGFGNQAKAAAAGAARGLTLGASDYVASKIGGDETRHSLEALRRQNPVTSGVSEVLGAAAPVVLSGGSAAPEEGAALAAGEGASAVSGAAGLASQGVRAAGIIPRAVAGAGSLVERGVAAGLEGLGYEGKSLAGRVAAGALKTGAAGAVEGAVYGGAQAADDSVLKGDAITAEKVVAGMGQGALFGGSLGAGLGAAAPLASAAISAIMPGAEDLENLSRDSGLKAIGRDTEKFGKDQPAAQRAATRQMIGDDLRYTLKTGEQAGEPVLAAGDNVEGILSKLTQAKRESGAALGGVKQQVNDLMLQKPELAPNMDELFTRIQTQVLDPLNEAKSAGSRAQARAVERELSILKEEHQARALALMDNAPADMVEPSFLDIDKFRQNLDSNLNPKGVPKAMVAAGNKNYQALDKTSKVINDYLKEKAENALAQVGEDPGQYRELSRQYFSFSALEKAADKSVQANARNRRISPSDHALGLTAFLGSLATGNVGALGALATGAVSSIANKLIRERGNSMLSVMAARAAKLDESMTMAAKALAGRADAAKAITISSGTTIKNLREEYTRTAERVRELSRPEIAQQHVSSLIPEVQAHYPDVGSAISNQLLQIYQHLGTKLPPSNVTIGDTLTPLAIKDRASAQDMRKFMSTVQGALHPEQVIKDLAAGRVDNDELDSFKTNYPKMFAQLREKAVDEVGQREEPLSYNQRIFLSTKFDFVGDSSMDPTRLSGLQIVIQQAQTGGQSGAPGAKPKTARPGPSKLGSSFSTPSASAFGGI
jgi:hypothetical protein